MSSIFKNTNPVILTTGLSVIYCYNIMRPMEKIDYFILSQELMEKREVDYENLIRETEPVIIKDFLGGIVQNFCIKDGYIESIRFKNGIEHRFLYKGES